MGNRNSQNKKNEANRVADEAAPQVIRPVPVQPHVAPQPVYRPAPQYDPYPLRPTTGPRRGCGCSWYWECSCNRVDCVINPNFEAEVKSAVQLTKPQQSPSDVSIHFVNQVIRQQPSLSLHDVAEPIFHEEAFGAYQSELRHRENGGAVLGPSHQYMPLEEKTQ